MKRIFNKLSAIVVVSLVFAAIALSSFISDTRGKEAPSPAPKEFTVVWSIYAGWNPWAYAGASGIMDKWATKYGIKVKLVRKQALILYFGVNCSGYR